MKLKIKQLNIALFFIVFYSSCTFTNRLSYQLKTQIKDKKTQVLAKFKKQPLRVAELPLIPSIASDKIFPIYSLSPASLPAPSLAYVQATDDDCIDFEPLESLRDDVTSFAKKFLGTRYRSGGRSTKGFDCSNFTSYIMERFGYKIPAGMAQATHGEQVPFEKTRKGDLLFFGYKSKKGGNYRISHVAMVISDEGEEIHFIHAARRGIVIDNLESPAWKNYYKSRYLFAKRIIEAEKDVTLALKENAFVPKN
jgi:NlpC/P60 family